MRQHLGSRNRCQRLKRVDGAPHAKADSFGHLRKVDHVVSQEDEHRTVFRISLPPTSEGARPTDRSHAATPHEIGFVRLKHHRDTQAKPSANGKGLLSEQYGVCALAVSQLIGHHRGECFRTQGALRHPPYRHPGRDARNSDSRRAWTKARRRRIRRPYPPVVLRRRRHSG